ncbi:MAG: hypothetical protein AB7S38_11055 [Vulcanimicrobiota bacterium]
MEVFLLRIFPVLLFLGGVVFVPVEIRNFAREKAQGQARPVKLIRRLLGAVVLAGLAAMVFFGELPKDAHQDAAATMAQFQYWLSVLGLAIFLGCLAVWDALDGFRHLRGYLARVESEEIEQLHRQLGKSGAQLKAQANGKPSDSD